MAPSKLEGVTMTAARQEAATEDVVLDKPQPMLTEQQVLQLIPIGRTTLFRMVKSGRFPRGAFVSPNRRLWLASEIANWQRTVDAFNPDRRRGKGRHRGSASPT